MKADYESSGEPIVIRVYGCPAEEIMSGKIIMDEQNVFDDLSIAVTWHPFDRNRVSNDIWQAQDIKNYTFHGVSAHASRSPESGRSALDAAELMNIGVNYLREHVTDDARMHYAYMDNGIPANVVPDFCKDELFYPLYQKKPHGRCKQTRGCMCKRCSYDDRNNCRYRISWKLHGNESQPSASGSLL